MQKKQIAERIQQTAGISGEQAATLLDQILALLKTTLQKGENITIQGFGRFTVRSKAPRTGHNFQTGGALMISARRVVSFHPSHRLRTEVNSVTKDRQEAVTHTRRKRASAQGEVIGQAKQENNFT